MSDNLTALVESLPQPGIVIFDWQNWQYSAAGISVMVTLLIGIAILTFGIIKYIKHRRRAKSV